MPCALPEYVEAFLPEPIRKMYTIKVGFGQGVRLAYQDIVRNAVNLQINHLRQLIIRIQLFVNLFAMEYPAEVNREMLHKNGLYCVYQLVRGDERPTTPHPTAVPAHLVSHFRQVVAANASIVYRPHIDSNVVSCALETLSTAYCESLTVHFEKRMKAYVGFILAILTRGNNDPIPTFVREKLVETAYEYFVLRGMNTTVTAQAAPDWSSILKVQDMDIESAALVPSFAELGDALIDQFLGFKPQDIGCLTVEYLKEHPHNAIRILGTILNQYEQYNAQNETAPIKAPSFALLPQPGFHLRHVDIVPANVHRFTNQRNYQTMRRPSARPTDATFLDAMPLYFNAFNFEQFGYENSNQLAGDPLNRPIFMSLSTDGVSANFTFASDKPPRNQSDIKIQHLGRMPDALRRSFELSGVDPGRRVTVTSALGNGISWQLDQPSDDDNDDEQPRPSKRRKPRRPSSRPCMPQRQQEPYPVRRVTSREYRSQAGTTKRSKEEDDRRQNTHITIGGQRVSFKQFETEMPTAKTSSPITYQLRMSYIMANLEDISMFYGTQHSIRRFNDYRGNQRATAYTANVLTTGGRKYNKALRTHTSKNRRNRHNKRRKHRQTRIAQVNAYFAGLRAWLTANHTHELFLRCMQLLELVVVHCIRHPVPSVMTHSARRHLAIKSKNTASEPRKVPLIAFGNGMRGKMSPKGFRGHPSGSSERVRRNLLERQDRCLLLVPSIDEFRTSQRCPRGACGHSQLAKFKVSGQVVYALKRCDLCHVVFDRDVTASTNMYTISRAYLNGLPRPQPFRRPS